VAVWIGTNWEAIRAGIEGVKRRRPLDEVDRKGYAACGELLRAAGHSV
jgi:hypothetical protein